VQDDDAMRDVENERPYVLLHERHKEHWRRRNAAEGTRTTLTAARFTTALN